MQIGQALSVGTERDFGKGYQEGTLGPVRMDTLKKEYQEGIPLYSKKA